MPNRLQHEHSLYLKQHANNPVDWYPWGHEALDRARTENKPILVSVGYSSCHWCHVMAHESFEDETVATFMNAHFVNIKVDREDRPDVDAIYMEAAQALIGTGGWPLNVFLTPDARPFFAGTYFPPGPVGGRPSWLQVLQSVAATFHQQKDDIEHNADTLTQFIRDAHTQGRSADSLGEDLVREAYEAATRTYDFVRGGFGGAPKFPQPLALEFILSMYSRFREPEALQFLNVTLNAIASGGIYDHIGGGFHRYSVDSDWLVPHFEKMLYDNALLSRVYTLAHVATGDPQYRHVAEETLDYLLRDLRSPHGGFYSSQDADSEGVEGKYYLWDPEAVLAVVGAHDAAPVISLLDLDLPGSTHESRYIARRGKPLRDVAESFHMTPSELEDVYARCRKLLLEARYRRVPPAIDPKVLTGWNALAVRSLAVAGRTFGRDDYLDAAEQAASFILNEMHPEGVLVRGFSEVASKTRGFLEDYAYLIEALLDLSAATGKPYYATEAFRVADDMLRDFWDESAHSFFDVAAGQSDLIIRPRTLFDNPIPSGSSAACFALLKLEALTGNTMHHDKAMSVFRAGSSMYIRASLGFAYALCALDFATSTPAQIALASNSPLADPGGLLHAIFAHYLPTSVVSVGHTDETPLLTGRTVIGGKATAYVCENFACRLPVVDVQALSQQLNELERSLP